jgi:hypothetical protein
VTDRRKRRGAIGNRGVFVFGVGDSTFGAGGGVVKHWHRMILLALAVAAIGCGNRKEAGGKAAPPSGIPDDASAAAAPPPSGTPDGAAIDDAQLAAFLERWLAAQNQGDLAAYQELYAAKLTGIKRVGFRVFPFDRKGWLADRARMFQAKRPMVVTAEEPRFHGGARSATIDFVQTFSQGSFKDRGPKQLVVVREGDPKSGALKIAREEMLASTVESGTRRPLGRGTFFFIKEIAGRPYAVLDLHAEPAWSTGPNAKAVDARPYAVVRPISATLPPDRLDWRDRTLAVYSATGERCDKTLNALSILAAATPHFGTVAAWTGNPQDGEGTAPVPLRDDQIADEIYQMAQDSLVLVAPLGRCDGVFATAADKPPAVVFSKQAADEALAAKVMTAARALPAFEHEQREFVDDEGGSGDWFEEAEIAVFENAGSGRRFVTATLRNHGCASYGWLFALWEVDALGLTLVSDPAGDLTIEPEALVDLDGDGRLEVIGPTSDSTEWSVVTVGTPSKSLETLRFPYLDCDC